MDVAVAEELPREDPCHQEHRQHDQQPAPQECHGESKERQHAAPHEVKGVGDRHLDAVQVGHGNRRETRLLHQVQGEEDRPGEADGDRTARRQREPHQVGAVDDWPAGEGPARHGEQRQEEHRLCKAEENREAGEGQGPGLHHAEGRREQFVHGLRGGALSSAGSSR